LAESEEVDLATNPRISDTFSFQLPPLLPNMRRAQPLMIRKGSMSKFGRGLRVGALLVGLAALTSACAQLSEDDRALLEQARADAAAAQAAANQAAAAADRAAAAASQAADAASNAQMAAERQERMVQQTMRK
jgi:hypothetical protein